jgi:hypothetical protein
MKIKMTWEKFSGMYVCTVCEPISGILVRNTNNVRTARNRLKEIVRGKFADRPVWLERFFDKNPNEKQGRIAQRDLAGTKFIL